ncbi:antitoxin MazE-like protein [Enterovirga aerilata]|uniref:DUF3018 family protein n=1 Tax=Enterovirga aerilata TaxID=2730920 RepID=A0A849IAH7_9HYPH|nr:antitoxin MazE-like protein [Enterovirga sp. DB1703]NNM73070.1 DUF3018 family protein [Enterovirga sp. DB1703]
MRSASLNSSPALKARRRNVTRARQQREHLKAIRTHGLRRVTVWIPDPNSTAFAMEAHRQSELAAASPQAAADQAFVDAISIGFDDLE